MVVNPLGALKLLQKRPWFHADSGTSRKLLFIGRQSRLTALFANGRSDVESSYTIDPAMSDMEIYSPTDM